MSVTAVALAVLMGQSAFSLAMDAPKPDAVDVAYNELASGQADAALRKLQAGGASESKDPATLINLGNAYARTGQSDLALQSYRAAIDSPDRYQLQIADGTWLDSRQAARRAVRHLLSQNQQAAR